MTDCYTRNCLSFWFDRLRRAGLPVPRTIQLRSPDLRPLLDGETPERYPEFLQALRVAGDIMGYPCFLRTGQGADKHSWKDTCLIEKPADFPAHVVALVEWSECVDILGLPHDVWAVREMLPTLPVFHAFSGDMPIVREFRAFVRGPEVTCIHPYWPKPALDQGFPIAPRPARPSQGGDEEDWVIDLASVGTELCRERVYPENYQARYDHLCRLFPGEQEIIGELASRAGKALTGEWSVDLLSTTRGWYVTDCAVAAQSYHWPDCPQAGGGA